jgi:hypothetical protein
MAAVLGGIGSEDMLAQQIPLFNIWDAISFVYIFYVENIRNQIHAELHLYLSIVNLDNTIRCALIF